MKTVERTVIAIFSLIILFVSHHLVSELFAQHKWVGLDASAWASWVQAVGSIAAIYGAFAVANKQHKDEQKAQRAAEDDALRQRYAIIEGILKRIRARLHTACQAREDHEFYIATEEHVLKLRATAAPLEVLPPFEMPSADILMLCLAVQGQIHDVADILLAERTSLLNRASRPEGVEDEIRKLESTVRIAIRRCDRSAAHQS